ncbi:MAG: hypothetical protein ACLTER_16725 [Ruminococcus sp.]
MQMEMALSYFEGLSADTYTGEVTLHDGTKKTITVPVARNDASGTYYLADVNRHTFLADYYSYDFRISSCPGPLMIIPAGRSITRWPMKTT